MLAPDQFLVANHFSVCESSQALKEGNPLENTQDVTENAKHFFYVQTVCWLCFVFAKTPAAMQLCSNAFCLLVVFIPLHIMACFAA